MRMIENIDYVLLTPPEESDKHWHVKIVTGDFQGCVIRFNPIKLDPEDESIRFSFIVLVAINLDQVPDNPDLREVASNILFDLIERNVEGKIIPKKDLTPDE